MAGIIAIYGLVVSVLISHDLSQNQSLFTGFIQLGAGLSVGLAGLAAGFAIGIVGDAGVRGTAQQPRLFVGMILILIFAEVLGKFCISTTSKCFPVLTLSPRSLRSDCRSSHELAIWRGQVLDEASIQATARDKTSETQCAKLEVPEERSGRGGSRGGWPVAMYTRARSPDIGRLGVCPFSFACSCILHLAFVL